MYNYISIQSSTGYIMFTHAQCVHVGRQQRMYVGIIGLLACSTSLCWASYLGSQQPGTCRYRSISGAGRGCGKAAAALCMAPRQIWIKRQLLSTEQTDGRTPERYTDAAPHSMRGGVNKPLPGAPRASPTQLLGTSSTIPDVQPGTRCCMMCNYCAQTRSSCPDSDGRPPRRRPRC